MQSISIKAFLLPLKLVIRSRPVKRCWRTFATISCISPICMQMTSSLLHLLHFNFEFCLTYYLKALFLIRLLSSNHIKRFAAKQLRAYPRGVNLNLTALHCLQCPLMTLWRHPCAAEEIYNDQYLRQKGFHQFPNHRYRGYSAL